MPAVAQASRCLIISRLSWTWRLSWTATTYIREIADALQMLRHATVHFQFKALTSQYICQGREKTFFDKVCSSTLRFVISMKTQNCVLQHFRFPAQISKHATSRQPFRESTWPIMAATQPPCVSRREPQSSLKRGRHPLQRVLARSVVCAAI